MFWVLSTTDGKRYTFRAECNSQEEANAKMKELRELNPELSFDILHID